MKAAYGSAAWHRAAFAYHMRAARPTGRERARCMAPDVQLRVGFNFGELRIAIRDRARQDRSVVGYAKRRLEQRDQLPDEIRDQGYRIIDGRLAKPKAAGKKGRKR